MFSVLLSLLIGKLGLGLLVSIGLLAAWYFIPDVPWLTHKLRTLILFAGVVVGAWTIGYGHGAANAITDYKAKLARQIDSEIKKGEDARAEALKKFDADKDIPDDGFERN